MPNIPCIVCHHADLPPGGQTCEPCVAWARRQLIRVEQLYPLLEVELLGRAGAATPPDPTGIRSENEPIPGGDILVMLAPGSVAWHSDAVDVDSVLGVLERWDTDWRITLHEAAATDPATVTGCSLYLLRRLSVAAQRHHAFDEFAEDIRSMRQQLETALRLGPQRTPVPCITCGHRALERPAPRDDGRAYEWQCAHCHRNYTDADYWMAMRQHGQAV